MGGWPTLNFPRPELTFRRKGTTIEVLDRVRKRWLVLTPEEWVRRHVIDWLIKEGVAPESLIQEYPVELNGQPQRADIVWVGSDTKPRLVVECKSTDVELTPSVLDQVVRYNYILKARYVMLTNGLKTLLYEFDGERYTPTKDLNIHP